MAKRKPISTRKRSKRVSSSAAKTTRRAGRPASAKARRAAPRAGVKRRTSARPQAKTSRRPSATARRSAASGSRTLRRPNLNRSRRIVLEDDIVAGPPSTLGIERVASAARTGRKEMLERLEEHTETSPVLTGGDVDADWETAYSSGDEAPGGDNPTPDQDVVEEIGRALGVEYEDNEELKSADKVIERDRHRWELDPASSEDYPDRTKRKP